MVRLIANSVEVAFHLSGNFFGSFTVGDTQADVSVLESWVRAKNIKLFLVGDTLGSHIASTLVVELAQLSSVRVILPTRNRQRFAV